MSIDVLKKYVEECFEKKIEPTFKGLNIYYNENIKINKNVVNILKVIK